jgi:hypothetical protein
VPAGFDGRVGIVAVTRAGGEAELRLSALRARSLPYRVRPVAGDPSEEELARAAAGADALAALGPPWLVEDVGGWRELPVNGDLLKMAAARWGWDLVASVVPGGASPPAGRLLDELAERAVLAGWQGLALDCTRLDPLQRERWQVAAQAAAPRFAARGLRLLACAPEVGP